jgi:hypothetical protein
VVIITAMDALLQELALAGPVEPFLVYADALQRAGDPWGQLIALACSERPDAVRAYEQVLAEHGAAICALHGAPGRTVEWTRGFATAVIFSGDVAVDLERELVPLLAAPVGALLERLCFEDAHLDDAHAESLLRHAAAIVRVAEIDLTKNWFSLEAVHELRAAFPQATLGFQRRAIRTVDGGTYRGLVKSWDGR